jgi:hypothetical protein
MRLLTIGILALLAGGCAAGREFDLVALDPEAPWLVGHHWVRTESSRATVNASFDRAWLDHLLFEVEVVNQSDSVLVVDPTAFSYTLSSSSELPPKLRHGFAAVDPAVAIARAERATAHGSDASLVVTAIAGLVLLAAVAADVIEFGNVSQAEPANEVALDGNPVTPSEGDAGEGQPPYLRQTCERYTGLLLRRTELAPGESVRGELWLPAWPVLRALGPERSEDSFDITATHTRPSAGFGLTLHAPASLGAQSIVYSLRL